MKRKNKMSEVYKNVDALTVLLKHTSEKYLLGRGIEPATAFM